MTREHLYKAKRVNWRELPKEEWWAEGAVLQSETETRIATSFFSSGESEEGIMVASYLVEPETVCEYTELIVGNERKVFEGDILSFSAYGNNYKGDVRFIKGNFIIWCGKCAPFLDDALEKHSAIVIGNVHDNPELLQNNQKFDD